MATQRELAEGWLRLKLEHTGLVRNQREAMERLKKSSTELDNKAAELLSFVGQFGTGTNSKSKKAFRIGEVIVLVNSDGIVEIVEEEL